MKNLIICISKKKILTFLVCFTLLFSHIFLYIKIDDYRNLIDSVSQNIYNSFNFNDQDTNENDNNIFFVFNLNEYINLGTGKPTLFIPSEEDYTLEKGIFTFTITTNFVVKCAGTGLVKSVGYQENGLKYVEIRHSGNIVTRYENLKIVGVGENFNVKKIHVLGTCDEEEPFIFKILKNNQVIDNYTIENGKILWQN